MRGNVALVTGAARRLGRTIARALAEAGADLAIHYRSSTEQAAATAEELRSLGVRVETFQADLTAPGDIEALFDDVESQFGRLDLLVNSAAIFERKPIADITLADWNGVIDLNLRAPFFCSQRAARLMGRQSAGAIINIADVAAFQPWPGYAPYSISKAGLVMMTRVLARALAPAIRVNAVAPGPVLPPDDSTDAELEKLAGMTVLDRLGSPEDVASAVLFLVRSNYITGETILVDGGKNLS
jgi:NAD(P)-dependent dehydrogenase (short-subunit alcohol dehydrogenase family)